MDLGLKGKTALVTGAGSGIGRAVALAFAAEGANVALTDLEQEGMDETLRLMDREGSGRGVAVIADAGKAEDHDRAVAQAVETFGGLHAACNNAGIGGETNPVADLSAEGFRRVIEVNLLGVFYGMHAQIPAMLRGEGGAVVNIASIAGINHPGSSMAYGATKAGVISLTRNLARSLAPEARVNAVAPGAVDSTWMIEWTPEQRKNSIEDALLKRRCTPEDLAEVIVFLLAGAAMVTGQTVVVDGGLTV